MYPAMKEMNAVHSGTGVFYQAMPAVGADGKNIMKLIPVQMVNGQFVQTPVNKAKTGPPPQKPVTINIAPATPVNKPKTGPSPQKPVTINIVPAPVQVVKKAALNPSATQQVIRKQVSIVNALPNRVGLDLCNSLNKHPLQQQTVNLMAKVVPQMTAPATNCEKSVRVSSQLPVTVKSPALPSGQYLQIPPNAQVRTVPASELPPGIKKQIFTSSANPSPGSGSPSVVYVSPITTVNPGVTPPRDSAFHSLKLLSKTSNKTSCEPPSKGAKKHLKLIPKVSQRPNSPLKWMIEEEDASTAPSFDPLNSPSITSEILLAVAERENSSKHSDVITEPELIQSKSGQGQENALVMCNGKVFFVAKKHSLPPIMGKNDSPAAATKSSESNKTVVRSSQRALEPVAPEIRQDVSIIISDESDEVIDLCDDDDAQDDSSQQAASVSISAVTHLDEDNVIFVSYIPPKSASGPAQDLGLKTQAALGKETDQMDTGSSNSVTRQKSLDGTTGGDSRDEICALGGDHPHVCDSAVMIMHVNEGLNINSQQSTSTQQLESMDVDTESPADPSTSDSSSGICCRIEEDTHKMESSMNPATSWTSSLAPKSHQMTDHLLREIFKITADVKICLQRIDDVSAASVPVEPLQSQSIQSVEDHQILMKGLEKKEPYSPQGSDCDDDLVNVKGMKELTEQKLSADPAPHTLIGPLKCSNFKLNTNALSALCNSGQSSFKATSCNVETEPVIDYVEPIDEDFLSTNENDIPNSQDIDAQSQTPTCVDLNTNTRRMGRTRKRTICPCCVPGTQAPVVKSSAKSVEPDKWVWMTSKKGGRTKAVRKEVKTFRNLSCLTAKNKQKCKTSDGPASESLSSTSMDSDELKRHEQIKRLKELLREKEAALELMRNNLS